jgi:hypothetical protein
MKPIGHLPDETNHQAGRDAAAGPPVGRAPRGEEWPGPVRPQTRFSGNGPKAGCRFRCATCTLRLDSIVALIQHTITTHKRGPYDTERIPLTPAKT